MKKYIIVFVLLFFIFYMLDIVYDYAGVYLIGGVVYGTIYDIIKCFVGDNDNRENLSIYFGMVIFIVLNFVLTFKFHKITKYCIFIVLFLLSYFVDLIAISIDIRIVTIAIKSLLLVFSLYLISFKKKNGQVRKLL